MNNMKNLNKAIKSAREKNQKVSLLISEIKAPSNEYDKIIFAYVLIVLEHHKSIVELTNVRQISALALIRPLYEAYIRTHWLVTCVGSEKANKATIQLVNDVEDGNFPTLKVMCSEIDEFYNRGHKKDDQNAFSRNLEHNKKYLHSFTHGGAHLIAIINNEYYKITYKEMVTILNLISMNMLSATLMYGVKIGNLPLCQKIDAIMKT